VARVLACAMHLSGVLLVAWLIPGVVLPTHQAAVAPSPPPAAREAPDDRGTLPLWRVRDGERTIAWLLGSIHALPKERYPLPAAIDGAFAASGTLIEEVDLADMERPETLRAAASRAFLTDGTTLDRLVGAEIWAAVRANAEAAGLPVVAAQRMKPWMAAIALVAPVLQRAGYDPAFGVDRHFYDRARARPMPVEGLETPAFQFETLDGLDREVQIALLSTTLEDLERQVDDVAAVSAAWARGDTAVLERLLLEPFRESPQVYARLLVDRNRAWVAPVVACAKKAAPCFVVVGTAHLLGPDSLVALLRARGLSVEQQ
jgi:uncharacterized protein YbaP (TraB family)